MNVLIERCWNQKMYYITLDGIFFAGYFYTKEEATNYINGG